MIKRIELINFMSHPHTVIEPADGLTVLTGENNTGKSAVIAALQILARNTAGDFMMRHGERECRIIVETHEGDIVQWQRKNKTVSYMLNGREIHRLRNAVPEDLHDLLKMPLVDVEGGAFDVHFGEQKKPIFLLDDSPARRATFFASASDTIKLIEMQNVHRQKVRDAKLQEKRLEADKARLDQRLEALAPLEMLDKKINDIETVYTDIQAGSEKLKKLETTLGRMRHTMEKTAYWADTAKAGAALSPPPQLMPTDFLARLIRQINVFNSLTQKTIAETGTLADLPAPPALSDTKHLAAMIERIQEAEIRRRYCQKQAEALTPVNAPPEMKPTEPLKALVTRMQALNRRIRSTRTGLNLLGQCPAPPDMQSPDGLKRLIDRLHVLETEVLRKKQQADRLSRLSAPPQPAETQKLENLIEQIKKSRNHMDRLAREMQGLDKELSKTDAVLRRRIQTAGICPTCGQPIDPDHFMETALGIGGSGV
ncbi:MAG: AAA family ATPase [Desulfobacterales bacterium]|nr:AAA family ATPase [Desulfobacterales bacterium]